MTKLCFKIPLIVFAATIVTSIASNTKSQLRRILTNNGNSSISAAEHLKLQYERASSYRVGEKTKDEPTFNQTVRDNFDALLADESTANELKGQRRENVVDNALGSFFNYVDNTMKCMRDRSREAIQDIIDPVCVALSVVTEPFSIRLSG